MLELFRGGDGGRDELFSFEGEGAFLGGEGGGVDDVDVGGGGAACSSLLFLCLSIRSSLHVCCCSECTLTMPR